METTLQKKLENLERALKDKYPTVDFGDGQVRFLRQDGLYFWLEAFYGEKCICPQFTHTEERARINSAWDGEWYDEDMTEEEMLEELLQEIEDAPMG